MLSQIPKDYFKLLTYRRSEREYPRWSIARHMIDPPHTRTDAYVFEQMPYVVALGDDIILTRETELIGSLLVHGVSADTVDQAELWRLAHGFAAVIDQCQGSVCFYVNRISTRQRPASEPIEGDGFAAHVDQAWTSRLARTPAMHRASLITVGIRRSAGENLLGMFGGGKENFGAVKGRLMETLNRVLGELAGALHVARPERLNLSGGKWLGWLAAINEAEYSPFSPPGIGNPIAVCMAQYDLLFKRDTFTYEGMAYHERTYGAVLSLKRYPNATHPGMFDGFDLPCRSVVTHAFSPVPPNLAEAKINTVARQMRSASDSARSLEAELLAAADGVASQRLCFGYHHCTVALHADSEAELNDAIGTVKRVGSINGGRFHREGFVIRGAFFAQNPGNQSMRPRSEMVTSRNFAAMAALHNRSTGAAENLPWGAPVVRLRTRGQEDYSFNFHPTQRSAGEVTPGHTLILGRTGSGKSVLAAFLMTCAKRFDARIFAFDKDRGLEIPLRALGADYTTVRIGQSTGLNPFAAETDARGQSWLASWVERLITHSAPITSDQRNAIAKAAEENGAASREDAHLNTFRDFVSFFRSLGDGGDLMSRLEEWVNGRFAWAFDGGGEDPLADPARSVGFDVTELFDEPVLRSAWLGYVFRRIERMVEDNRPTLIVMDEAWKLLDDPVFVKAIEDWLLVMRKKNAVVVMLTQQAEQITRSAARDAIAGNLSTRIAFMSGQARPDALEAVGFTKTEAELIANDAQGRRALVAADSGSVILDLDLSGLGGALAVLSGSGALRNSLPAGWENDPDFWRKSL